MGYLDFVSEIEASSLTGVSRATLNRFVEAGYLQIETDSDGLRLFSKNALIDLFGMKKPAYDQDFQDSLFVAKSSPETDMLETDPPEATPPKAEPQEPATPSGDKSSTLSAKIEVERSAPESSPASNGSRIDSAAHISKPAAQKPETRVEAMAAAEKPNVKNAEPAQAIQATAHKASDNDFELFKLKQINSMLEKLLDIREGEIARLKEENTWLKGRVERFESKSDRDQMLLLSETQLIRSLLHYQEQRKSSIRVALEWLGFAKAAPSRFSPPPRDLIDVGLEKKDPSR